MKWFKGNSAKNNLLAPSLDYKYYSVVLILEKIRYGL